MTTLTLSTSSLLSKWGFNDGSPFEDVEEWFHDSHGAPPMGHCNCGFSDLGVDDAALLRALVERFVLPALDQRVEIIEVETSHNPVRASKVDGVDVEDCWYDPHARVTLTPETVEVPYETVIEVAARLGGAS